MLTTPASGVEHGFYTDIYNGFILKHPCMAAPILTVYLVLTTAWFYNFRTYRKVLETNEWIWRSMPELPIFQHTYFMTRINFTGALLTFGFLLFIEEVLMPKFGGVVMFFAFLILCLVIGLGVFLYLTALFGQVYQILMAMTIFENCLGISPEDPGKIELKQMEKELWIKYLYRVFIFRDVFLTGGILIVDLSQVDKHGQYFYYFHVFMAIFHGVFYLMVPVTLIFYLSEFAFKGGIPHQLSPLFNCLKHQAVVITAVQTISFTTCCILVWFNVIPSEVLIYIPHCIALLLPVIIQGSIVKEFRVLSGNETYELSITMIVFFFFFFILLIFGQIYQVLIAITTYQDCTGTPKIFLSDEQKRKEKLLWKRCFYIVFVVRDIILMPFVMWVDRSQEGKRPETFYFTKFYIVVFHNAIYSLVPLAILVYAVKKLFNLSQEKIVLNPLQLQLFYQAVTITTFQLAILTGCFFIPAGIQISKIIPFVPQAISLVLPLIIQSTTWVETKIRETKNKNNISAIT